MGNIPQDIIDRILERLDIVEIISEHIQLKKAGRNFKACCPFHNEKTPSFVVSPDKQIYHCFGCGAGGNAMNFVMKYENLDFPETVRKLAAQTGIEIPRDRRDNSQESSLAAGIYEVNKLAATFYQNMLHGEKGKKALEYLKKRGVEPSALSEFRIGYAPDEWEALRKYCESKKVSAEVLRKAGLTIPSEKGKSDYDRFRNRITFPIFDERGNVAAFGGRVMDDSLPKYINSPETAVYSKSNILYGLNFSKRGIRDKGYAIIVEGYMDVVIPFQHGVRNIVATSGTALTPRQVGMLKRNADTAVIIFDADQAGEAASLRGLDVMIENGMNVRLATLPKGDDPDTFVKKNGAKAFEEIAGAASDIFDYKLSCLIKKLGPKNVPGVVSEMLPTIKKVQNEIVRSDYVKKLSQRLFLHEQAIRIELNKVKDDYSYRYEPSVVVVQPLKNYRKSEIHLLSLSITGKHYFSKIAGELGDEFFSDPVRSVMSAIGDLYEGGEDKIDLPKLLSRLEGDENAKTVCMEAYKETEITQDFDKVLSDCVFKRREEFNREKLKELKELLREAQANKNQEDVDKLVGQINRIHKEKIS